MIRFVLPLMLPLVLGGCMGGDFLARAYIDAAYLQITASDYVREVHALRQMIRQECEASLLRSIHELRDANDEEGLRKLLAKSYPDLVTVGMFKAARDDQESILSKALGCG